MRGKLPLIAWRTCVAQLCHRYPPESSHAMHCCYSVPRVDAIARGVLTPVPAARGPGCLPEGQNGSKAQSNCT